MTFAQELKLWRGKLYLKEAAEKLGVGMSTYVSWEYGSRTPTDLSKAEIRRRMVAPTDSCLIRTLK